MKKLLIAAGLLLLVNLPVLAVKNAVTLNNRTNTDIVYMLQTIYNDGFYGIKASQSDVYHAGQGDEYATLLAGVCKFMPYNGGACKVVDGDTLRNCVGGAYYNFNLVKEVNINSLRGCTVTCLDGSTTSCKVN